MPSSRARASLLGLALLLAALLLVPTSALAARTHIFKETFGSASQPSFAEAGGLAVDQSSGDLLVIDGEANTVSRYNPDGTPAEFSALGSNEIDGSETPQGELSFGGAGEVQIAVDNSGGATDGDIYVPQWELESKRVVDIFAADGSYLGQLTESSEGGFSFPCGAAVDPSGNLYVGDFSGQIHKFEPAANPVENADSSANFPFASNCTLAAGAGPTAGFIFPTHYLGAVWKLDSTSGEEKYEVDSGPTTTVTVDPASGHVYTATGSEVKEYDASGPSEATLLSSFSGAEKEVKGIAIDKVSGNVYVARAENPNIEVWGPAVLLPDATTEAASVVNGSVTLRGVVNASGGPPATCVFEYVEIHAKGFEGATSVPCSPAGPFTGTSGVSVSAKISSLPEAAYRFRLVASNENGSNEAQTLLFDTFARIGLPDGRAYEMVSPPRKSGGEVFPPEPSLKIGGRWGTGCPVGECYPGFSSTQMPMQATPDGEALVYEGQAFSGAFAASANEYLSHRTSSGWETQSLSSPLFVGAEASGYRAFSSDLSRGVAFQVEPALSPEAPTREGKSYANLYLWHNGALQPIVSDEPPHRTPGGAPPSTNFKIIYGGTNLGASSAPAFSHVIFAANDALTEEDPGIAPEAPEIEASHDCIRVGNSCDLYEWSDEQLHLVNVLPDNATAAPAAVFGSGHLLSLFPEFLEKEDLDVDHAISADGKRIFWSDEATGQVYVRIEGRETKEIQDPGMFLTASVDGSRLLLSDGCLYDLEAEACDEDLSQGEGGFQGILGASEDLSGVYFVDTAVLSGGEENANEEHAEAGKDNLYAWHDGATVFVGALLDRDNVVDEGARSIGAWHPSPSNRSAQVSSDGRYLAFMSAAPLTGYDNELSGSGGCKGATVAGSPIGDRPCFEVFEFDASSESLSCASCNPTGQRPLGGSNLSLIRTIPSGPASFPQPENLTAGGRGRLFFESQDELSPRDTDGDIQDVYEWEPGGVGSCQRAEGCVYLISSGRSSGDSMFLNSTPSGNDAFFITRDRLLPPDQDEKLDLYDARVGGGIEEVASAPCSGEACKGTISGSPAQRGAGSSSFSGPGNQKPHKRKKHHRKKHKRHAKQRSAKHNRGGSK
jgi:hypothetical protein